MISPQVASKKLWQTSKDGKEISGTCIDSSNIHKLTYFQNTEIYNQTASHVSSSFKTQANCAINQFIDSEVYSSILWGFSRQGTVAVFVSLKAKMISIKSWKVRLVALRSWSDQWNYHVGMTGGDDVKYSYHPGIIVCGRICSHHSP